MVKNNFMGKTYLLSLDISTTNIGFALWGKDRNLLELKHLELKTKNNVDPEHRDVYKSEVFKNYLIDYQERIKKEFGGIIDVVVVEKPLGGSNNQNTTLLLYGFNGMCRRIIYELFNTYPIWISIYDARKAFCPELVKEKKEKGKIKRVLSFPKEYRKKEKKLYIWEKVSKLEPDVNWIYKKTSGDVHEKSFDMSDAYVCGYAAFELYEI